MTIPNEYQTAEFWSVMRGWVYSMLRSGYMFRKQQRYFDQQLYRQLYQRELSELATDLIEKTLRTIRKRPEPTPPIVSWRSFFHARLTLAVQSEQRNLERRKCRVIRTISLETLISDPSSDSKELRQADTLAAPTSGLYSMQGQILELVIVEVERRVRVGIIRDREGVQPFIEIVRRFLQDWETSFDQHIEEVAELYPNTPSKANARRWWQKIRESLPMNPNDYR